jgi:ABC-type nitrate/sulfonate/bicarbonate transport system permease component
VSAAVLEAPRTRTARRAAPRGLAPLAGVVVLLLLWQVAAVVLAGRHIVPTPLSVVQALVDDGFYGSSLATTAWEALRGYLWGNAIAFVLAAVCVLVPPLQSVLTRLAVATYCTPTIAVGPLLIVLFSADTTKVVMSALSVFFLTLLGALLGLSSAPRPPWTSSTSPGVRAPSPSGGSGCAPPCPRPPLRSASPPRRPCSAP